MFGTKLVTPGENYMTSIPVNTVLKNWPSFSSFTATEIAPEGIEVKLFIIFTGNTESMNYHNNIHLTQIENDCKSFAGEILKSWYECLCLPWCKNLFFFSFIFLVSTALSPLLYIPFKHNMFLHRGWVECSNYFLFMFFGYNWMRFIVRRIFWLDILLSTAVIISFLGNHNWQHYE